MLDVALYGMIDRGELTFVRQIHCAGLDLDATLA